MKFRISSKVLSDHLSVFTKVVNSKNTISILNNFLFDLQGDQLLVEGSDSETSLKTVMTVEEASGNGKVAINVKKILNILKELPEQGLQFEIDNETHEVFIYYLNGKFNFMGLDGNEFPQKEATNENPLTFNIDAEVARKGIENTIFSVAVEDARPVMMGILWDIKPEEIVFVASDTHMLVKYTNRTVKTGHTVSFIMPSKPAAILQSVLAKSEGEVSVSVESKSATFSVGDYSLNCRFVNGKFPNYNSVIPKHNEFCVTIDRVSFANAIRRMGVLANPSGHVRLDLRTNEIFLSSQDIDSRTMSEETVPCNYVSQPMTVGYNHAKVIVLLNNIHSDNLYLRLNGPASPGVFEPDTNNENEEFKILLMPMMA